MGYRQRRNTLPNMKQKNNHKHKHKHRRSIPPYVKEDELTKPLSLIKRMIKLPFIYPVKIIWWIYGMLKYLLLGIVWLFQNFGKCILSCFGIKFKSQEQEMLQLQKDNIYYKKALSETTSKVNALEMSRSDALSRLERALRDINDLRRTKDEALSRLSAMMGAKLRDNNPAITDLNDPNRPMKIGEQFSGVYENEWTDAFLNLSDMKSDDGACINEEEAIVILLNILREVNEKSIIESNLQLSELLQSVQGRPQEVTKSTKDAHKANAIKYIPVIYKKIMCEDSKCKTVLKYTSHCQSYIEKCLKVCYFAAVQDPPMFIDFQPGEDTFDRQVYKEYTQMGTKVKFLVWPALFLHEGGALISKGVLQPIPDTN